MTRNNVRIAIRDSTDSHNVAFFDNRAGIKYKSANLQRFLAGLASILTLKYNSKDIDSIRSGCKLAFRYKNRDYWLNVMNFEKKGFEVELTAYSLGLELNNETRGEHKPANAMSIAEYVAYYDPEHALTIGVNEVADKRIKLEWTGTDTILARLFSVANSFDAELDFNVELNDDYSLKRQVLNIYKKGNLGTNKLSQPVRVGKELKVINYSDNIKELKTAVRATGKDGLTIDGLNKKIYDDNKELLYYSSGMTVYAPQSRDRFPSVGKGSNDNWIVEDLGETQYETKEALWGYLYSEIQKKSLPEITYEVEGAIDAGIGDTQTLIDDKHFEPALYVQARVSELEDDILTGKVTKSTFINFERKYSQIADELQKRVNELVEASIPYTIKVSSDNGTVFKNSTGTSTFKARVFKGEKEITSDVTWRWALDGNVTVAMQYLAKASTIKDTAVLTVSAYIGNNEVATTEITLTNVNDGADGAKGDKGEKGDIGPQGPKGEQGIAGATGETGAQGPKGADGKTSYIHIKYAPVANPSDSQITDTPNAYIGVYTDYNSADSTKASAYTWSKWQGEDGAQGIQGPKGTDGKTSYIHFAYANSADGKTNFSTTYFSGALYVGTLTDYNSADSTTYSAYTWSRLKGDKGERGPQGIQGLQGPKGDQGIQGVKGADGKTQYTHIAYADNATGGGFSQTDQTKAYIGMYVDFNATDSNDPTKYKWSKWKGDQGLPGKPGTDGKTPYVHFAYADDDKGTNLSFTDKNQQYQGYYSDYTEANSTDYKKYTWVDRLANVQIDQLNLIGAFNLTPQNATFDKTDYTLTSTTTTNTKDGSLQLQFFDAKNVVFTGFGLADKVGKFAKSFKITKAYERFRIKINGNASDASVWCYDKDLLKLDTDYVLSGEVLSLSSDGRGNGGQIKHLKIQKGKLATGFSKAPQDVDSDINSKADQTLTQEQLNALEAKRLQMEVEVKAKATLEQVSELETFINNLKKEDLDGRQKIIEITKAIEERVKDIEPIMEYSQKLQFIDTYITQGNGGMIIGKNDSSTKVVVTPDRISFQSGGSEVAYISQSMLHIDNGVFTLSLQLGHYITRVHPKNEYVNGTYFVK